MFDLEIDEEVEEYLEDMKGIADMEIARMLQSFAN